MYKRGKIIAVFLAAIVLSFPASGITKRSKQSQAKGEMTGEGPAVLWRDPTDIAARNLYYGPGGEKNQPHRRAWCGPSDISPMRTTFSLTCESRECRRVCIAAKT